MSVITDYEVTRTPGNFEKYDPYVEKIRALFVPSLEPRIHSCLENFVYREDADRLCNYPCLKRCLEVAATLREPVDAFYDKWGDEGFLENIISHGIRYLIRDGLIDCFINSIILNNRLNKVCRDLDALGVERDFLRSSNVWNYINERDYWMENDPTITRSVSSRSCDFVDRQSDLDVETGSEFRNCRNIRVSKRFSANVSEDNDFLEDCDDGDRSRPQLESWLSRDSSVPDVSRSTDGKIKTISQPFLRGSSNCSTHRLKNSRRSEWEGKVLRIKLSGACTANSTSDRSKFMQLSILSLPCRSDDLISKLNGAESTLGPSSSMFRKKKFRASVDNVCRRINETLGRIRSNDVTRCRLHCEIFPNHLNFKMTRRECNGYSVCLLTDRVTMSKIGDKPRGSSFGRLPQITENEISREAETTIHESGLRHSKHENRQRTSSSTKIDSDSKYSAAPEKSKKFDGSNEFASRIRSLSHFDENRSDERTRRCDVSAHSPDQVDTKNNATSAHPMERQTDENPIISKELSREESPLPSNRRTLEDRTRVRSDPSPDVSHNFDNALERETETEKLRMKTELANVEGSTRKNSFLRSTADHLEKLERPCDDSNDRQSENVFKESSIALVERSFENPECLCGLSLEKPRHRSNEDEERTMNRVSNAEHPDKSVDHDTASENRASNDSASTPNRQNGEDHENGGSPESMLGCCPEYDRRVTKDHSDPTRSKPDVNVPKNDHREIPCSDVACECRYNCTCEYEKDPGGKNLDCDSQCSCDSCHDEEPSGSLNRSVNVPNIRDDSSRMLTRTTNDRITSNPKVKARFFENRADPKESEKVFQSDSGRSFVPLKSVPTKVLSRPMDEREADARKLRCSDQSSVRYSETNESKEKSSYKSPPVLTTRFPRSKGRRINISIELCRESESSTGTIVQNNLKNIPTMHDDSREMGNFGPGESGALSLLRESGCRPVERDNREMRVNQPPGENTKDECLGGRNGRVHSPSRPLESRDSLLTPGRLVSSVRNSIVHENPIKSGLRSSGKFDRRSMSRARGTRRDHETREFREPIRNDRCLDENNRGQMQFDKREESTRSSRNTERITGSFVSGHLCHAFSSSSIDRMRHLIKTKLRRILLERDKSTNTPKTILTNKKYRVSVPNGKTERPPFARNCCRTIWESRSASDSTRTSRSFGSENHTGSRDRDKICHLLYSSERRSKVSSSNFETISRNSDPSRNDTVSIESRRNIETPRPYESSGVDSTKDGSRLAGGSDFIPSKKIFDSEVALPRDERRYRSSVFDKKNRCTSGIENRKHGRHGTHGNFRETFEKELRVATSDDRDSRVSRKNYRREFVARSRKFDSPLDTTSERIYLDGVVESSNDDLSKSRSSWNEINCQSPETLYPVETRKDRKSLRKSKKVSMKKHHDSRSKRAMYTPNGGNLSRSANGIKNSSFDTYSISAPRKGFNHLDYDLRSKLSEYVNLCKNVKYSLLKRLRIDGVDEAGRTSLICGHL